MRRLGIGLICVVLAGCGDKAADDASRAAAEKVIALKGKFHVFGRDVPVKTQAAIPEGSFSIRSIDLQGTKADDAVLEAFQPLRRLERLNLQSTYVTSHGLVQIQGLKNLQELDLYGTGVDDSGLTTIAGFKSLTQLELSYTGTTDNGLPALAPLTRLKRLNLYGTQVTTAGAAQLKATLPHCEIYR